MIIKIFQLQLTLIQQHRFDLFNSFFWSPWTITHVRRPFMQKDLHPIEGFPRRPVGLTYPSTLLSNQPGYALPLPSPWINSISLQAWCDKSFLQDMISQWHRTGSADPTLRINSCWEIGSSDGTITSSRGLRHHSTIRLVATPLQGSIIVMNQTFQTKIVDLWESVEIN